MTAQVGERLIYEGEELWMSSYPELPAEHPRVVYLGFDEMKIGDDVPSFVFSTACWRQYVGTWELRDGRLYLNDVKGSYRMTGGEPIFAEWVSGVLRVPRGKVLSYVHMGFETVTEEDLFFSIEKGVLVKTWTVDNRGAAGGGRAPSLWQRLFGRKGS